jgi:hypothetical protein
LQLCKPSPAPRAVKAAISTEITILMIFFFIVRVVFSNPVQKYYIFLTYARKSPTNGYLAGDFWIFTLKTVAESGIAGHNPHIG